MCTRSGLMFRYKFILINVVQQNGKFAVAIRFGVIDSREEKKKTVHIYKFVHEIISFLWVLVYFNNMLLVQMVVWRPPNYDST